MAVEKELLQLHRHYSSPLSSSSSSKTLEIALDPDFNIDTINAYSLSIDRSDSPGINIDRNTDDNTNANHQRERQISLPSFVNQKLGMSSNVISTTSTATTTCCTPVIKKHDFLQAARDLITR